MPPSTKHNLDSITQNLKRFLDQSSDTGTIVGHLEAVHNKGHRSLMYSLLEDDGDGLFLLNPHSGAFFLSRTLDFDAEQFYVLTAAAQYRHSQLTRVRVYISVADVNDNLYSN